MTERQEPYGGRTGLDEAMQTCQTTLTCPICGKEHKGLSAFYRHLKGAHQAGSGDRTKFNNRKVELDGFVFDSKAEAQRYQELKMLDGADRISSLKVHPVFSFVVNGIHIGRYTADFEYDGIVEDVKSEETRKHREYRRNLKLMKACLGITVQEVLR